MLLLCRVNITVLTGAVLMISIPSDGSHETDGRQDRYHPLKSVKGTSILTKWPVSRKHNENLNQTPACMRNVACIQNY